LCAHETIPAGARQGTTRTDRARKGALIREFREECRVTRAELTKRMGWRSQHQIASYEGGFKAFSEDQQERILDAIRAVAAEKAGA
jgi:transcriptional regulator with XRE-family HTH domain